MVMKHQNCLIIVQKHGEGQGHLSYSWETEVTYLRITGKGKVDTSGSAQFRLWSSFYSLVIIL